MNHYEGNQEGETMTTAQAITKLMAEYNRCRKIWEARYGTSRETEFHAAFSKRVGL